MNPERAIERFIEAGIIADHDGEMYITSGFKKLVEAQDESIDELEFEHLADLGDRLDETGASLDADFMSLLRALEVEAGSMSEGMMFKSALLLYPYMHAPDKMHGTPEGFLVGKGSWLKVLGNVFPKMIVYVWREDCDPCDRMKTALARVDIPENVVPVSIFGPDSAQTLRAHFDVQGGPTTLFISANSVVTRLHGAHPPSTIEQQLEELGSLLG